MSIDIKILKLALESLISEVDLLKNQNLEFRKDLDELNNRESSIRSVAEKEVIPEPILLDTKEVRKILGISHNTLQSIVGQGKLKKIRIGHSNIRYSRAKLIEYLENEEKSK